MQGNVVIRNLNYNQFSNFDLDINEKGFISIIGSNNSGKTTLFKIISGIIPTTNVLTCFGIDLNRQNVNRYIRQIGLVFPVNKTCFLHDNVFDEFAYPLRNLGYSENYIKRQISKILKLFALDISDKKISSLSLREKQLLIFVLALIHNPKLLLIDDAFNYLNEKDNEKVISILKKQKKLLVINFTSNLRNGDVSDYLYVIDKGNIVLEGKYYNILDETKKLIKLGFEIPFVINLSNKLRASGLSKKDYYKLEDLVNDVWQ